MANISIYKGFWRIPNITFQVFRGWIPYSKKLSVLLGLNNGKAVYAYSVDEVSQNCIIL